MKGKPLNKAKAAAARALKKLQPGDSFQIIRFSVQASQLGPKQLEATPENVRRGLAYLASLNSTGGTQMVEGVKAALDVPHDVERLRVVSFLTDGYIGNEAEIFREVYNRLGAARIFSFGIGNSVNRHLLEGLARLGRGAVAYVGLDEGSGRAVDLFYDRVRHPAMTDIEVDWGGMQVSGAYPQVIPDLFVGRPVILTGRFEGEGKQKIIVKGKFAGMTREIAIDVDLDAQAAQHVGIPSVWARTRIAALAYRNATTQDPSLPEEIKEVALEYGLMSSYTAFVAVDSTRRTEGAHGTTVQVPVPVPDGVRYDTTVGK